MWCADGTLLYCGRGDGQIKILGHRVEVGEVQTIILQHPAVAQAACIARGSDDEGGSSASATAQSLCCYIVLRSERVDSGTTPPTDTLTSAISRADLRRELRGWCLARLPKFAVPTAFVLLDELPLTNSMKIDTRRLPIPSRDDYPTTARRRPTVDSSSNMANGVEQMSNMANGVEQTNDEATDAERAVGEVWQRCIGGAPTVSPTDDFFDLGGNSLAAVRIVAELRDVHGASQSRCTIRSLFDHPVLRDFCVHVALRARECRHSRPFRVLRA
jgi:hypothetical protein